jgi:hypothetical protein
MEEDALSKLQRIENDLYIKESELRALIDDGEYDQAKRYVPIINEIRKKAWKARGKILALNGGGLFECVALALTGIPIVLRWQNPETGSQGLTTSEPGKQPIVDVAPYLSRSEAYEVFLHELGHVVDNEQRDPRTTSKESRESNAQNYANTWKEFAEKNGKKYDQVGRNGVDVRLKALLDYPNHNS